MRKPPRIMRPSESDPPPNARHFSRVLIESGYMNEAVACTGISESELRRHMAAGRLPSRLFCGRRRFLASDLEKFVGAPLRLMWH
jgi:hypothetical protein